MRALPLLLGVLCAAASAQEAPLTVTVVDDSTGAAVAGATVVADGRVRATSGADGAARLAVEAGVVFVQVEAEGYDPVSFTTMIGPDGAAGEVGLLPAARRLGEVVATAERPRADLARVGFYERRAEGRGEYLDREELDLGGKHQLVAALTGLSGVRMQRWTQGGRTRTVAVSRRGGLGPDGFRTNAPCPLTVYKDGTRIADDESFDVSLVGTADLAGIEVYPGPATVPAEFQQFSPCGVILLWSRNE